MLERMEDGVTWTQGYNAENRLASVSDGEDTWSFTYDGDGRRVRQVGPDGEVTLYLGGGAYEVRDAAGDAEAVKYYGIAGQRVALSGPDGLQFLLTDHLGSVSAVLDAAGNLLGEQRYTPFGEVHFEAMLGTTDFSYTGQRLLAGTGLTDYHARFYAPGLGRWTQPDTIVPGVGNPQAWNRFSYVTNSPTRFIDPDGHCPRPTSWNGDTTSIICVALYIPTETILAGSGLGDNRQASSDSNVEELRGFVYIELDSAGNVSDATAVYNSSCLKGGVCLGPFNDYNEFVVEQNTVNNEITVSWKLTNGVSATFLQAAKVPLPVFSIPANFFGRLLDSIDGTLTLSKQEGLRYRATYLSRDPYPNLEVYQYTRDEVQTLLLAQTPYDETVGPLFGLSSFSKKQTLSSPGVYIPQ